MRLVQRGARFAGAVLASLVLVAGASAHAEGAGNFARGGLPGAPSASPPPPAAPPQPAAAPSAEPPASAPSPNQASDVVLLKDGSMFRGTIAELVTDDHVLLVTVVGEPRRFEMSQVAYAGRAEDMPPPAGTPARQSQPSATEAAPQQSVPVRFSTGAKQTTSLHVWSYIPAAAPPRSPFQTDQSICVAPCETTLPAGTYRFGVSGERGRVEHVSQVFEVRKGSPLSLVGTYNDRRAIRTAGWVLLGFSALAGIVLTVAGTNANNDSMQIAGLVGGVGGTAVGLVLGLQLDDAKLVSRSADIY